MKSSRSHLVNSRLGVALKVVEPCRDGFGVRSGRRVTPPRFSKTFAPSKGQMFVPVMYLALEARAKATEQTSTGSPLQ